LALAAVALALGAASCGQGDQTSDASDASGASGATTSGQAGEPDRGQSAFLSAYLGVVDLSEDLTPNLEEVADCELEALAEGLPVVVSRQVDAESLDASDFVVTTSSGREASPTCATLAPADDDDELQTVLLVGELGTAEDRPARITIAGELQAADGTDLRGLETDDIDTFEDGPEVVLAKIGPAQETCRSLGSTKEIQTTWQGGITGPRNSEVGAAQLEGFTVADDRGVEHGILGFDDLGDGDNYLVVCAPVDVAPATIGVRAATLFDPTNRPNPETGATVTDR
jgi:FAD/FMN-containing dehydrogenase